MKDTWKWDIDPHALSDRLVDAATKTTAQVWIELVGRDEILLTEEEQKQYRQSCYHAWMAKQKRGKNPVAGVVCFYIWGTTYSGNPVRTTLGNTLRSICYMYFYGVESGLFNVSD